MRTCYVKGERKCLTLILNSGFGKVCQQIGKAMEKLKSKQYRIENVIFFPLGCLGKEWKVNHKMQA